MGKRVQEISKTLQKDKVTGNMKKIDTGLGKMLQTLTKGSPRRKNSKMREIFLKEKTNRKVPELRKKGTFTLEQLLHRKGKLYIHFKDISEHQRQSKWLKKI